MILLLHLVVVSGCSVESDPTGTAIADQHEDQDGDGYPAPMDCNEGDAAVNPGALEVCANSIDDNCDGRTDGGDATCPLAGTVAASDGDVDLGFSPAPLVFAPAWTTDSDAAVYLLDGTFYSAPAAAVGPEAEFTSWTPLGAGDAPVEFLPLPGAVAALLPEGSASDGNAVLVTDVGWTGDIATSPMLVTDADIRSALSDGSVWIDVDGYDGDRCAAASLIPPGAKGRGSAGELGLPILRCDGFSEAYEIMRAEAFTTDVDGDGIPEIVQRTAPTDRWGAPVNERHAGALWALSPALIDGANLPDEAVVTFHDAEADLIDAAAIGDADGDGYDDIAVAWDGRLDVFTGPFEGVVTPRLAAAQSLAGGVSVDRLVAGDLDGDGTLELAVAWDAGDADDQWASIHVLADLTVPQDAADAVVVLDAVDTLVEFVDWTRDGRDDLRTAEWIFFSR